MRRQDNLPVAHFTDDQRVALHAPVALHQKLIAQMEGNVLAIQLVHDIQQGKVVAAKTFVFGVVVAYPRGRLRVHDQRVHRDLAACQQHPDAGHGVIEHLVICPPGLLAVHGRRVIALADAAQGVSLQMLAHQVDAANHHPFVVPLQLVMPDIMPAQGEGLGQDLSLSSLGGSRGKLCLRQAAPDVASQPVHAGNIEVFVVRHARTVGYQL